MESQEPLISCIVPLYNTRQHLAQCVESLLAQTYGNIEFVFVDDCSTDGSLAKLKELLANHPRHHCCKVTGNDVNRGPAAARAIGINSATGDYLMFCDSDDWVDPDMASGLMDIAIGSDSDIVCSSYHEHTPGQERTIRLAPNAGIDLNNAPIDTLHFALWNKLFRASLIKQNALHNFTAAKCWDDLAITAPAIALSRRTITTGKAYYHYRHDTASNSLTAQRHHIRLEDHLLVARHVEGWFTENGLATQYEPFLKFLKFTSKIKMLRGEAIDTARWKSTFPETNRGIMGYSNIPLRYRLALQAANLLPASFTQRIASLLK